MILALLLFLLAAQGQSPEALQHMQAGAEAEKSRHFETAIAEFRKVTELEPRVPAGFVRLEDLLLCPGICPHAGGGQRVRVGTEIRRDRPALAERLHHPGPVPGED